MRKVEFMKLQVGDLIADQAGRRIFLIRKIKRDLPFGEWKLQLVSVDGRYMEMFGYRDTRLWLVSR